MDAAQAYEQCAESFMRKRDPTIGARTIEQWCLTLKPGASVLELACGAGYPVTRVLDHAGLQLCAIDSSPSLVGEFEQRFPHVPVQCERVQDSLFFSKKFDAIVAVGLVYLLPEDDQHGLVAKVSGALKPAGRFLFTAPVETGEWLDTNTGVQCRSPGYERYKAMCSDSGLELLATFSDSGNNNYYDTRLIAAG